MNLKSLYDDLQKAESKKMEIANSILALQNEGKIEEALALAPQLDETKKKAKDLNQLYLSMLDATRGDDPARHFVPAGGDGESTEVRDMRASNEYVRAFIDSLKVGATPKTIANGQHSAERFGVLMNALTETGGSPAGSEGGFLLPVDFDNMIHELKRQYLDLINYVNVENVTMFSGWRAVEKNSASQPFVVTAENDDVKPAEEPRFKRVEYKLKDLTGYMTVSNDLLSDTPVNVMAYLARWLSKKSVLTHNSMVQPLMFSLPPVAISATDNLIVVIKSALNLALDPDVSASATIFVNQTGFDLLDKLEDANKRPLLQPDPVNATQQRLFGRPVVRLADRLWANVPADPGDPTATPPVPATSAQARIAIGDGSEFMTFFNRMAFEMASTSIGGTAWRKNNTEIRAIMRADAKIFDDETMVLLAVELES